MNVKVNLTSPIKAKNPVVIVGIPGVGLVGSIATTYLIDQLKFDSLGYFSSDQFAPLAAIHDYIPMPAARIHGSEKENIIVIVSEMAIPVSLSHVMAERIFDFAKSINASMIITLGGISLKEEENAIYVVSSDRMLVKDVLTKKMARSIKEGASTGVTGLLLAKGNIEKFPVVSILAEASQDYPDPKASANALRVLSEILGRKIETAELEKEAKAVSQNLRETMIKSKVPQKKSGGSIGPMYG